MAGKKSIENRKSRLQELNTSIENKSKKIEELENAYDKAFDSRRELEGLDLDEETKAEVRSESTNKFRELEQKGQEASDDLNDEVKKLDAIRTENIDAKTENDKGKNRAQNIDSVLGKVNIDSNLARKFEEQENAIAEVSQEINNTQQKLSELSARARSLGKHRGG